MRQSLKGPGAFARGLFLWILCLWFLSASSFAYEEQVLTPKTSGRINGTVMVDEDVKPTLIPVTHHSEVCGNEPKEGGIHAVDRRVRDVAVYLDQVSSGKPLPTNMAVLNQQGCMFIPRVFALPAGQPLLIRNSDKVLHNVMAHLGETKIFDLAMPVQGQELWRRPLQINGELIKDGRVRFSCRAGHTWMESWAIVKEHPYIAVTGENGDFELTDVPPGEYKLIFWHPVLGEHSQRVQVTEGEGIRVDLTLPVP